MGGIITPLEKEGRVARVVLHLKQRKKMNDCIFAFLNEKRRGKENIAQTNRDSKQRQSC